MPTTALATRTAVAATVLVLAATGTAVAFAAPLALPDEAAVRVAAAQAHRTEHASGASTGSSTTASDRRSGSAAQSGAENSSNASSTVSSRTRPTHPAHPAAGGSLAGDHELTAAAAFGLCTAFQHGGLDSGSTAYASLAKAAGGAAHLSSYCAAIAHPGNPDGTSASHPGAPSTPPPTGKPADPGARP